MGKLRILLGEDHTIVRQGLRKILEACTREASGELQEALRHMAAALVDLGHDVRAILVAVQPQPPPG